MIPTQTHTNERIRIQKFLSQQGVASRRTIEQLIREKRILVNGTPAHIGQSIVPGHDSIKVNRVLISQAKRKRIVLAMNKPSGYVVTRGDPNFPVPTVFDLLTKQYQKEHFFCVGRLDKDSEGLLLFTNDGALAQQLTHPSFEVTKHYTVVVHRAFDPNDIPRMLRGIVDEGERLTAKKITVHPGRFAQGKQLEIQLQQGKKREIRRLLEHFGYFVKRLKRFQIGKFAMKRIPSGATKELSEKEISSLLLDGSDV